MTVDENESETEASARRLCVDTWH